MLASSVLLDLLQIFTVFGKSTPYFVVRSCDHVLVSLKLGFPPYIFIFCIVLDGFQQKVVE